MTEIGRTPHIKGWKWSSEDGQEIPQACRAGTSSPTGFKSVCSGLTLSDL